MALQSSEVTMGEGYQPTINNSSLKKLCYLLRNEGHRVLNGNSAFTLTTDVLVYLNKDCRRHSFTDVDVPIPETTQGSSSFFPLTKRMQAHKEAERAKAEWSAHIQFIKDFMLSTPSLKIIHNSSTITSPISLHRFGNLQCLHLRRVPIHMVEGLQQLRCTLSSVTVFRSIDKLKDLLESCGGDMTSPMTWPMLKFLSLKFNSLTCLDDSLRLLPFVEVLDLSHNSLHNCDKNLEYLGDVVSVTLAYNFLVSIPSFSVTTRSSLTSLILRGNNLDKVTGLNELIGLQDLDLGENCINDHSFLEPLGALTRLKQLQMDGNPIFYHRLHRPLTVSCLSGQAVNIEFELDKKKLTMSEITHFGPSKRPARNTQTSLFPQSATRIRTSTPERANNYKFSPSSGIGTETESNGILVTPSSSKKAKRKRLKARKTEIRDMDTSGDVSSSRDATPGTSPAVKNLEEQLRVRALEANQTKMEIEELRKHYGPNWLQAIEDRDIFKVKKLDQAADSSGDERVHKQKKSSRSTSDSDSDSKRFGQEVPDDADDLRGSKNGPTDDDLYLRDTKPTVSAAPNAAGYPTIPSETTNPIMAEIARLAAGKAYPDTANQKTGNIPFTSELLPGKIDVGSPKVAQTFPYESDNTLSNTNTLTSTIAGPGKSVNFIDQQVAPLQVNTVSIPQPVDKVASILSKKLMSEGPTERTASQITLSPIRSEENSEKNSPASSQTDLPKYDVISSTSTTKTSDEVTEPIFVTLPLQDNKMIIVSLTDKYLVEKDIKGKIKEKLELASLTSMESATIKKRNSQTALGEEIKGDDQCSDEIRGENEDSECLQLDLKFDYMRKDRQKRCYHLESGDGKIIQDLIQPILDAREAEIKAKSMVVMQCLKCNRTFLKSELVQQRRELPTSGSSRDLQSLQELMEKPTYICPKCGSTIIIELEPATRGTKSVESSTSTPVGSHTSAGGFMDLARSTTPLSKRKSAELQGRKNSTSSLDFNFGTKGGQPSSVKSYGASPGSLTREVQMRSAGGRDRSNAFNSKMAQSVIVHSSGKLTENDELICVEDYFAKDSASQQLAAMTTSLREDMSTRGTKSVVRRSFCKESTNENMAPGQARRNMGNISDSGFESGIYRNSTEFSQSSLLQSAKALAEGSRPTSIAMPIAITTSTAVSASNSLSEKAKDIESVEKKGEDGSKSSAKGPAYKHLAAMEHLVNTLVTEGKELEEQELLSSSYSSRTTMKSVSVSLLKKSSTNQRRGSINSTDGTLRLSESSSSIAILPTPAEQDDGSRTGTPDYSSYISTPVKFSVGTPNDEHSFENPESPRPRVVSPLNSDICSSMISSVYETSVNALPEGDATPVGSAKVENKTATSADDVKLVGSSDSEHASSTEDLTSIYDKPTPIPANKKKKLSKKNKSKETVLASPKVNSVQVPDSSATSHATHDGLETSEATVPSPTPATQAGFESSDESDEEEDDADVVPQYAFHHLNHHLTLYMMMSLFGNDEEFVCKLQSEIVQYIINEPYEGILVLSTSRFYILKIISEDHSLPPEQWLNCVEIQPINELRYIDVGLGGQSLRLEFNTDCSSYTFVTRNLDKTLQFVEVLHTYLAKYAVSQGITSHVVVHEDVDQATLNNLDLDVVSKGKGDQKMLLYCMGFIERGNQKLFPVSFVITSSDICLVRTNYQWPQPRLQAPITVETVGKQFTVLERQKINNVASVEVCESTMKKMKIELFNEVEGISANWNITLTSKHATVEFIHAISVPWAQEFGVEMDFTYNRLDF